MKKLLSKIIKFINQPSDKANPNIFIALTLIMIVASKFVNPKFIIVFGVFTVIAMLIYTIMSIIKHEDITKILICITLVLMSICVAIAYYLKYNGVDLDIIDIILPIVFMIFFIEGYLHVKKSGNSEKIKQMKIPLILAMPLLIIVLVFFIYTSIIK